MRLFTLFPNLITKESYNWWVIRRFWGFRQQISKAKYLKISQNIGGKYHESFKRTQQHCAEWLLSHPGRWLSDDPHTSVRRSWNALLFYLASEFRTWTSEWKCAVAGCNGGSWGVKNGGAHPGGNGGSRVQMAAVGCNFYPDMLSGCPSMVYPDALSRYTPCMDSKELSSISDLLWWSKSYQNTKT